MCDKDANLDLSVCLCVSFKVSSIEDAGISLRAQPRFGELGIRIWLGAWLHKAWKDDNKHDNPTEAEVQAYKILKGY